MYSNANLARELRERISTASIALLTNGVDTRWDISKQGEPTCATASAECFALHNGILKVSDICNFSSSIGYSIEDPSAGYEDNA
eukprot:12649388-Ditylum_brightwellii.AAC.1